MTYISAELRHLVIERAGNRCEHCLIRQDDMFFSFEIDHIIDEKHRGDTNPENLCLSCPDCNAYTGSDIGSIDVNTGRLTPLFNPRQQHWSEHFRLNGAHIEPLTPEGRVTVFLLKFNDVERVADRLLLITSNRYP